jgi:hypothetical protein
LVPQIGDCLLTAKPKEMKKLNLLSLLIAALVISCSQKKPAESSDKTTLLEDSSVSNGKNVTVVRDGDKLRPGESMGDIKDQPNIAQVDIEAINKVQSKEIRYLKSEEKVSLEEKAAPPEK